MRKASVAIALALAAAAGVWAQHIRFVPFKDDSPAGPNRVFASGFQGKPQIMNQSDAAYRPTGLAQARDGSIYVSDDVKGRIWKITYSVNRAGTGE